MKRQGGEGLGCAKWKNWLENMLRKGDEESGGGGLSLSPMMFWSFMLKAFLEALILTMVLLFSLTLSTFWVVRNGYDFSFLGPFMFPALLVLIVFGPIEIVFSLGMFSLKIHGCVSSIIHCGYIMCETNNIIKRFSSSDYTMDSILLSLNIINLFVSLCAVTLCRAADRITAANRPN